MFSKLSACLTIVIFVFQLNSFSQIFHLPAPTGSGSFGTNVTILTNGNYVVADPTYSAGGKSNIGAVYLYNGKTHQLISTLIGDKTNDKIGSGYINALPNGHFVVTSPNWNNNTAAAAGAVTWVNGFSGISGTVSSSNSMVGTKANDLVGNRPAQILANSNYVISTTSWDNGSAIDAGAVTLCSGTTGRSGFVSASNSVVGDKTNDRIGSQFYELFNSNFITSSLYWANGTNTNAGAVTWVNGNAGLTGVVSAGNSLVGSTKDDEVYIPFILRNGNYVVVSAKWDNGAMVDAGAATWGDGNAGVSGVISSSNSLVGTKANDKVSSSSITPLTNGNYVINSPFWDNESIVDAGASTWGSGTTGVKGVISSANSLVGSKKDDKVGGDLRAVPLSNGNYVVQSPKWDNASIADAGAATWGNGNLGVTGEITSGNSLVGSSVSDQIGSQVQDLGEGNYAVASEHWSGVRGAVTWSLSSTGIVGTISAANSLVGTKSGDRVGSGGVVVLKSGNYVAISKSWINGGVRAGAATFINASNPLIGPVTLGNSMVGTNNDDFEVSRILPLANGNYVIGLFQWDNGPVRDAGAVFWGDGNTGVIGTVSSSTALVGTQTGDMVGYTLVPLNNGGYMMGSTIWNNGTIARAGFVKWSDGISPLSGTVNSNNSLVGTHANDNLGGIMTLNNSNILLRNIVWDNGNIVDAGALTWVDGTKGITGTISSSNSLVGTKANDKLGSVYSPLLPNSHYLLNSPSWDNGSITDAGAVSWFNGSMPVTGTINSCNSVVGTKASATANVYSAYNALYDYMVVGIPGSNQATVYNPLNMGIANSLDAAQVNVAGAAIIPFVTASNCRIIAALIPTETSNAAAGIINAKVWVEAAVPTFNSKPMVARHWEITPAENANTATGRVTLYLLQNEFNNFNAHPNATLKLPAHASDATGIANLIIKKFSGISSNGTGLPSSYTEGSENINPADEDIIWNAQNSRWEISFDVTGFSGFIIQTTEGVLPLTLVDFKGSLQDANALLSWKTENEQNTLHFSVERSLDGRNFTGIANVAAKNVATTNTYQYYDKNIKDLKAGVIYYRLKQVDTDGSFVYSKIVALSPENKNSLTLYPNPAVNDIILSINVSKAAQAVVKIYDNVGRIVKMQKVNLVAGMSSLQVDVSMLAKGIYYLELSNETIKERKRLVKQ